MKKLKIKIIGGGLAGSEAALVLNNFAEFFDIDLTIVLVEMRPSINTAVHKTSEFAELVCSNSFKSLKPTSAAGMLKYELASLGSPIFNSALKYSIKAGGALAVDRDLFSKNVSDNIINSKHIKIECRQAINIIEESKNCDALIIATGPLTSEKLALSIKQICGADQFYFYDAAAPIVLADTIDNNYVFSQDRYSENYNGDYLNIALDKQKYESFIDNLVNAQCVIKKDFETKELFQACQPIEEIAKTGIDSLRYGALKPVGITDPITKKRPYAVVQLRAENKEQTSYNLVGFQTNLLFSEQKRVFSMLPGLSNAEFVRFGVMHKNTYINSPKLLNEGLQFKQASVKNMIDIPIFAAGQFCGTEGYLEAVRSGYHAALNCFSTLLNLKIPQLPEETVFGSLIKYASCLETKNYQPMHVNFGIIKPLNKKIKNKRERYAAYANRSKLKMDEYTNNLKEINLLNEQNIDVAINSLKILENMQKDLEKL